MRWLVVLLIACGKSSAPSSPAPQQVDPPAAIDVGTAVPAWGIVVSDSDAEKLALRHFAAIGGGTAHYQDVFDDVLIIGPIMWEALVSTDKRLAKVGTPSVTTVRSARNGKVQNLAMRTFADAKAQATLFASGAFRSLARIAARATPRPANDAERKMVYGLVPFEIAGTPITMLEDGEIVVAVYAHDGKLMWLEGGNR